MIATRWARGTLSVVDLRQAVATLSKITHTVYELRYYGVPFRKMHHRMGFQGTPLTLWRQTDATHWVVVSGACSGQAMWWLMQGIKVGYNPDPLVALSYGPDFDPEPLEFKEVVSSKRKRPLDKTKRRRQNRTPPRRR